jgi:hypothetical protein
MDARVGREDAAGLIKEGGMRGGKRARHRFLQARTTGYVERFEFHKGQIRNANCILRGREKGDRPRNSSRLRGKR